MQSRRTRLALAATVAAVGFLGPAGVAAAAPAFDVYSFEVCTATTPARPDGNLDAVVTSCCVDAGGVTAATSYGLGCISQAESQDPDYRPTVHLPNLPTPPGEMVDDAIVDELIPLEPQLP